MICLSRPYHFIFFKGCLPQILLGLVLNTLSQILYEPGQVVIYHMRKFFVTSRFIKLKIRPMTQRYKNLKTLSPRIPEENFRVICYIHKIPKFYRNGAFQQKFYIRKLSEFLVFFSVNITIFIYMTLQPSRHLPAKS